MLGKLAVAERRFWVLLILACTLCGTLTASASSPDAKRGFLPLVIQTGGWNTVISENFEGEYPRGWVIYDAVPGSGAYHWGKRTCRGYGDGASAWSVGGGADGAILPCGSNYPGSASSWMIYGPFSLADATRAELSFMVWANLAPDPEDHLFYGVSTDGVGFYGRPLSGSTGGWTERTLDLANVITLGSVVGQPEVWLAFVFSSGASGARPEGIYIDEVNLRKYVGP